MTTDRTGAERIATAYVLRELYDAVTLVESFPLPPVDTWAVLVVEFGLVRQDDAGPAYFWKHYSKCQRRWPSWAGRAEGIR